VGGVVRVVEEEGQGGHLPLLSVRWRRRRQQQ
jgi:hypothetical protein